MVPWPPLGVGAGGLAYSNTTHQACLCPLKTYPTSHLVPYPPSST